MNPEYILKLATTEPEVYIPPRVVPPLAQVKAQQLNVPLPELLRGSITNVMNFLTNGLKNKTITTKQGSKTDLDYLGAVDRFAREHAQEPYDDEEARLLKVQNSGFGQGTGVDGICDAMALLHTISDHNVIKGKGQETLSFKKDKSMRTIGKGRHARVQ